MSSKLSAIYALRLLLLVASFAFLAVALVDWWIADQYLASITERNVDLPNYGWLIAYGACWGLATSDMASDLPIGRVRWIPQVVRNFIGMFFFALMPLVLPLMVAGNFGLTTRGAAVVGFILWSLLFFNFIREMLRGFAAEPVNAGDASNLNIPSS